MSLSSVRLLKMKSRTSPNRISEEMRERNSLELRNLSEQLNAIVAKTTNLEKHLTTLELAKEYRDQKREKKSGKKRITRTINAPPESRQAAFGYNPSISSAPISHNITRSTIDSQIGGSYCPKRRQRDEPSMKQILDLINDIRRDVSDLATRQNELKYELETVRARLC